MRLRQTRLYQVVTANQRTRLGFIIIALILLAGVTAPWLAPYDPTSQDIPHRLAGPSVAHPLGTDQYGRDVLSRVIYGSRISLVVGVLAVLVGVACGTIIGLVSGYTGGVVDIVMCKVMDVLMSFPMLLLALTVVAILGTGVANSILAVGVSSIPRFARLTRGQAMVLKQSEYIAAVRALGSSSFRVVFLHLLPNIISNVTVLAALYLATAIIMEANLSFLGLGIQPPTPTWGAMINEGRDFLRSAPWVSTFPGLAIALTVLAFNLLGDALRDALDPKLLA